MKPTVLVAALSSALSLSAAALSADPVESCLAAARDNAKANVAHGMSDVAARERLEIDSALCHDPSLAPATARFIGIVNSDRARFAFDLLRGHTTAAAYQEASDDRRRKLAAHRHDLAYHTALQRDADRDLVPDDRDRCAQTPFGTPTDNQGCPIQPRPRTGDDAQLRRLLGNAKTLYNPSCKGADRPAMPIPLEWGRGHQTKNGTEGFNLAVTKVGGMPPGCEIFYEIQFRFIEPVNAALPPSLHVGVAFSESEELLGLTNRAVFGLPMAVALSPGRTKARDAFAAQYFKVTWRVRAVNGSSVASPWSPYITQGPAGAGVQG